MPEDDRITLRDVLNQMYRPDNNGEQCETSDDDFNLELPVVNPYPATDIGIDAQGNLFVEVAVLGFAKDNITILRDNDRLIVSGILPSDEEIIQEYYQQNILYKDFERVIVIDDKYAHDNIIASVENGLLTVMIPPRVTTKQQTFIEIH